MPATWASTPGTFCTVAERTWCIKRKTPKIRGNYDDIRAKIAVATGEGARPTW